MGSVFSSNAREGIALVANALAGYPCISIESAVSKLIRYTFMLCFVVLRAAVSKMNPALNAVALQDRVAPTTEGTFDDNFWEGLDVVVNALDNIKARQ